MFIQGRVLGTFVGQAVGAGKPDMAGVWLQVSLACLLPLTVIPLLLWSTLTSTVISLITADASLLAPGAVYAGVLASALPGRVLYSQISQYLTARHVMYPTTLSAAAALLANLGLGLFFILGLPDITGLTTVIKKHFDIFTLLRVSTSIWVSCCSSGHCNIRVCPAFGTFTPWVSHLQILYQI